MERIFILLIYRVIVGILRTKKLSRIDQQNSEREGEELIVKHRLSKNLH